MKLARMIMMKLRERMKQDKIDNDEETDEAVENDENDQLFIFYY